MKIIKQSWQFEDEIDENKILKKLELAGRTCYKSEDKAGDNPCTFVKSIMSKNHASVLEHASITVRIITDRGVTHELVRHRLASYSQESTRYCNYSKDKFGGEITVIEPTWLAGQESTKQYEEWATQMLYTENGYFTLLKMGWTPQQARAVLPNSLKTEIVMTANIREWKHVFNLRAAPAAHPQMRQLAQSMLDGFHEKMPTLFESEKLSNLASTTL
jgi:thymidylate synthase (FAD)